MDAERGAVPTPGDGLLSGRDGEYTARIERLRDALRVLEAAASQVRFDDGDGEFLDDALIAAREALDA